MRRIFGQPTLSRDAKRNLRREQVTELTVPVALAMLEGGFIGVIAVKTFSASAGVLALLTAAPMFGLLSSYFWTYIASARSKVTLVVMLQILTMCCLVMIALAPATPIGLLILVLGVVLARIFTAGTITIRSVVWSLNYGREIRARATGRLQLFTSLVMVLTTAIAAPLLDNEPSSFRWLYIGATAIATLGIMSFARVRVPGELRHRVHERRAKRPVLAGKPRNSFLQILRGDRNFARYELYQFLTGAATIMLEAPLIYLVSQEMQASYTVSIAISMIIPFAISVLTLPVWARVLDDVHVVDFRAKTGGIWLLSQLLTWMGALTQLIPILMLGRAVMGVARSSGSLAWQLGHNDFADEHNLSSYMAVHVTLTGIRGATAPFLGVFLYLGWSEFGILPAFDGLGAHVFLVTASISLWSWWGFLRLRKRLANELGRLQPHHKIKD